MLWQIDNWEEGKVNMLVQDMEQAMESFLSTKQRGGIKAEQHAKIFHRKILRGDFQHVVRYLTDRKK